jgi:hypothetical protein
VSMAIPVEIAVENAIRQLFVDAVNDAELGTREAVEARLELALAPYRASALSKLEINRAIENAITRLLLDVVAGNLPGTSSASSEPRREVLS